MFEVKAHVKWNLVSIFFVSFWNLKFKWISPKCGLEWLKKSLLHYTRKSSRIMSVKVLKNRKRATTMTRYEIATRGRRAWANRDMVATNPTITPSLPACQPSSRRVFVTTSIFSRILHLNYDISATSGAA